MCLETELLEPLEILGYAQGLAEFECVLSVKMRAAPLEVFLERARNEEVAVKDYTLDVPESCIGSVLTFGGDVADGNTSDNDVSVDFASVGDCGQITGEAVEKIVSADFVLLVEAH
jgi:hypothetical protein